MGTIDVAYNVEATALFFSRPKPDMGKLLTDLNTRLSDETNCHMQMSPLSHEDWWLLSCSQFHIMIAFEDRQSPDPAIALSAKSPVCDLRRFDYAQVVDSHRTHLRIEVGDGDAPLPPEARMIMQEFGSGKICTPDLKMKALHWTAQFIAAHESFLGLHFGPSDRLFCPEELGETRPLDIPTPLLMHPVPTLPEPGPGGVDGYHVHLKNPQFLDGPAISIEGVPVSIPLRTAVSLLNTLFAARAKGRIKLNHGNVIKPSAKLALYAREEPPSKDAPSGRVILSFWKNRGHDTPLATGVAPAPDRPDMVERAASAPIPPAPTAPIPETTAREIAHHAMHSDPQDLTDILIKRADSKITVPRTSSAVPDLGQKDAPVTDKKRAGPHHWLMNKLRRVPADNRTKIAGLAVILGLQVFWAPYGGFTGGIDTNPPQQATLGAAPHAAQLAQFSE